MDFRQIRYFVHVADFRNITRASSILRISQPALSRQMQLLEQELGTKLFHRQGHGLVLTSDGALFLDHCTRLLNQFEEVKGLFQQRRASSELTGTVGVGMPVPMMPMFADPFLGQFAKTYPGIRLRMAEGFSALLHEWLLSGSMDLALLYGMSASKVLVQERLLVEDLFLLAPAQAPFVQSGRPIALHEIGDMPMILPHRPHTLRDLVDQNGFMPSEIIEVDALTLMVELVNQGKGVTLLPGPTLNQVSHSNVAVVPLTDPGMNWDVTLCYSSLRPLSEAALAVHRCVRTEVRRLVMTGRWKARWIAGTEDVLP
ncbi:LysR family transcriptional regulator [Sphingobium amiense]|uniref:LysR family transcriptional regulator n=1 Tax=Sphingobium amiense TaxID=135719 RepID=A0A494WCW3_9SPHN|nr:LysR family transcriptional regulator [Sphingobium amiense]BBD98425.1 LysR family transcriptional regulator [Sphingobium amiense]